MIWYAYQILLTFINMTYGQFLSILSISLLFNMVVIYMQLDHCMK